ncbi:MAG: hypothetical protein K2X93_03075 [Candidatus Obscuribacterales bacterium]|nr:hypothetical protein [Candidatus Obscuribacterales bacterium]
MTVLVKNLMARKLMEKIYTVHLILIIALLTPLAALAADPPETKVNLNDSKITKEEKKLDEAQTQKANRFAGRQTEVINKVPEFRFPLKT